MGQLPPHLTARGWRSRQDEGWLSGCAAQQHSENFHQIGFPTCFLYAVLVKQGTSLSKAAVPLQERQCFCLGLLGKHKLTFNSICKLLRSGKVILMPEQVN